MKNFTHIIICFFVFCLFSAKTFSQEFSFNDKFNDANLLMDEKLYAVALPVWIEILQSDTDNSNWNYKVGFCYLNSNTERAKSLPYLQKAILNTAKNYNPFSSSEDNAPMDAYFYMGKSYHINNQFDTAIYFFEKFKSIAGKKHFLMPDVEMEIQMCNNAKEIISKPLTVTITNLGTVINTPDPEYGPLVSLDERALYFTSRRLWLDSSNAELKDRSDGRFFEDIYVSYKEMDGKWGNPEMLNFNRKDDHEATVSLSPDGQTIYLYMDDGGDGNLYQSFLFGETWTAPVPMGPEVNSKSQESHLTISLDNRTLYFASDRKGGTGGKDIYFCTKLPNGKWSQPQNIGTTINTQYDEDAPFIHPDGKTLYFSSKGHKSIGGFDIFMSTKKTDGTWTAPENIGYPINTTDDDVFFILSPDGKRAYYSSFRSDGIGDKDIYLVEQPKAIEKQLTLIKGYITVPDGMELPEDITIVITDNETGEFITEVKPLRRNGSFVFVIPPGKNYNISYVADGKEFYNENIYVALNSDYKEVDKLIALNPAMLGTPDAVKINIVSSTEKPKPQFQIRFREPGFIIPDSSYIQYLKEDGTVIYEELLPKSGFFNYYELEKTQPYIFTLKSKDSPLCTKGEIVLIDGDNASLFKLLPDENCIFKQALTKNPVFRFAQLGKIIPEGLALQYLGSDGTVLYEELLGKNGEFAFRQMPSDSGYIIKVKTTDPKLCEGAEIEIPKANGEYIILTPDGNCVFKLREQKPNFNFSELGKSTPKSLSVQYLDDSGKIIYEEKTNEKGEFAYHKLSSDQQYIMQLKNKDKTLCDLGEISVPGPNGTTLTLVADENCVFKVREKKSKFIYQNLSKEIADGLTVQIFDDSGNLLVEEKMNEKGEFAYHKLPADKNFTIKLKPYTPDKFRETEIIIPSVGKKFFKFKPDSSGVFRMHTEDEKLVVQGEKEKKSKFVYRNLSKEMTESLTVQILDVQGNILFEEKMNENGEFAYHNLPLDKKYSLKLLSNNNEMGIFKDAEIVVPSIGKSFQTFVPDESGIFRLKGTKDEKLIAEKEKEKTPPSDAELQKAVYFEYDKSNIQAQYQKELVSIVKILKENPSYTIDIFGHTDSKGTDEYNNALSKRRAENAAQFLVSKGISKNRISTQGFGETQPIAPNIHPDGSDNPEGRKMNRRIEVKVKR